MNSTHPLQWLDHLVFQTYNPASAEFSRLTAVQAAGVVHELQVEENKILKRLREQLLGITPEAMRLMILQLRGHISYLLTTLESYYADPVFSDPPLEEVNLALTRVLCGIDLVLERDYLPLLTEHSSASVAGEKFKVMLNLSGDQIALLLRAVSELKILESRSLSAVFRRIVPHLSTPERTDLSWNSMRGNSGEIEQRDRDKLIDVLIQLIQHLRGY